MTIKSDKGRIRILTEEPVIAGTFTTLTFHYTCGRTPITSGGGLEIMVQTDKLPVKWGEPQCFDPKAPGYVTCRTFSKVKLALRIKPCPPYKEYMSMQAHVIGIYVKDGRIDSGETIELVFGDRSGGSVGVSAPITVKQAYFPIMIYPKPGGRKRLIEKHIKKYRGYLREIECWRFESDLTASVPIKAGPPDYLHIVVPAYVRLGKKMQVKIIVHDRFHNKVENYYGNLKIKLLDSKLSEEKILASNVNMKTSCINLTYQASGKGVYYLVVEDFINKLLGFSNPFKILDNAKEQIWWGEIHAHTYLSDGSFTPEESLAYARDTAALDFAALADHTPENSKWKKNCQITDTFNKEKVFVTILGNEIIFSDKNGNQCHANIYYPTKNSLREVPEPVDITKTPVNIDRLNKMEALLVPHHTAYGIKGMGLTNWSLFKDTGVKILEIYSTHGNSERPDSPRPILYDKNGCFFQEALKKGLKLGVIASSDYHDLPCGGMLKKQKFHQGSTDQHMYLRTGLAAVRSPKLSRKDITGNLRKRHCYATTGDRVLIEFSINGVPMGEEITLGSNKPRIIQIEVAGSNEITAIELIKNNAVWYNVRTRTFYFHKKLRDLDKPEQKVDWYYLKIYQVDGEMAWSSPIWVKDYEKTIAKI